MVLGGPRREVGGRGIQYQATVLHEQYPSRQVQTAIDPVLGQHDGGAGILAQAPQGREQLLGAHGVELGGGFIEQK